MWEAQGKVDRRRMRLSKAYYIMYEEGEEEKEEEEEEKEKEETEEEEEVCMMSDLSRATSSHQSVK